MRTKQCFWTRLLVCLFGLLPLTANAQESVKLAEWNMESRENDKAATWFAQGGAPQIAPDECVGESANYVLTGWSAGRYWQVTTGYQNKVLRIENNEENNITDYTDASQHNVYYEVQFPTTGYKNISVDFACAYGANVEATLEAVVSTDGGTTWFDAGAFTTMSNWWLYKDNTVTISANNKEKVILRLIAGNGFKSNWNMDYVVVRGEKMEDAQPVDEKDFTLTWPLGKGAEDASAAEVKNDGLFAVATFDYGKLNISNARVAGTSKQTLYKPSNNNAGTANDDDVLTFTIKPKKGLTFTPKSFSFESSKWGTGGGKFDVVAIAGGVETVLATAFSPARNDDFSTCSYDLTSVAPDADGLVLKIKVYGLAASKEYGFGNVVVTGDVTGTPETVASYTMSVKLGTEGAGSISCNPAGAEFDEGTKLTVKATENFGYHFAGWADGEGAIVSTENPYTFEINANTALVATYTQNKVFALNMTRSEGANDNLVQFQPVGNVVDGVHYYEEGTDVKLTAVNNRIMTFTGWEGDATGTDSSFDIKMDGEKSVKANFSAADYIVGWDLYYDQPNKDRAADYKAESDNAGMLTVRQADGTTSSWLTRGIGNGLENGKYAARIWKPLAQEWYWEISFSSKGYENLVISSCLGDDYNTYSVNNVEYSIDGTNYTKIGEFNPPARGWDGPKEFNLPAEANDQARVYIRWMPDRTSAKVGVASDNDGTSIAEIFVLADALGGAEQTATLVSSNPAQGAVGVSANGSIILNFDNKIKAGAGKATLNGEEIEPIISGKSAIFKYTGLEYAKEYTFSMPEGVLVSRSGIAVASADITFTTMQRKQPEARIYDAIVAQDGSGDYTTVQAAIDAAPEGRAKPWLIFIKNGQYKEHVDIPKTKPYLNFIGQNRDKVVIKDDRLSGGDNAVHVSIGATVVVNADNIFFENLTMENIYGHEKQNGPQALALNTIGDRIAMNNVALLSYQDTWITSSTQKNRHYIKNSLIEGAVDFIYNGGDVYLDGDTLEINRPSGGYIVAPSHNADTKWGYVFQNTVIRPHAGVAVTDIWLGRPWHQEPKTVFINTKTYVNIPAKGWYNFMGGLPAIWAEYNTIDVNDNPVDLSQREDYYYTYRAIIDGKESNKSKSDYDKMSAEDQAKYTLIEAKKVKNTLTAEEAAQYTIKNVMGGDDNWQPDLLCEPVDAPQPILNGNTVEWEAVPYAICYVVTQGDKVLAITTETSFDKGTAAKGFITEAAEADYMVQAVNEQGGLSKAAKATVSTGISELKTPTAAIASVEVFTLDGKRINTLQKGINIIRQKMADGSVKTVKVIR